MIGKYDSKYLEMLKKEYEDILNSKYLSYHMFQRYDYLKKEIERLEKVLGE